MRSWFILSWFLLCTLVMGCEQQGAVGTTSAAVTVSSPQGAAVIGTAPIASYPDGIGIRSVDGDVAVLFAAMPAHGAGDRAAGVYAVRRQSQMDLGLVTPPPGGWRVPVCVRVTHFDHQGVGHTSGELLVLDAGGPPMSGQVAHVYRYAYSLEGNTFTATLTATSALPLNTSPPPNPPNGAVYPVSLALLPDGMVAVSDSAGAIWVSMDPSLSGWFPGYANPAFSFGVGPPLNGYGRDGHGGARPYVFQTPGMPDMPPGLGLYPGIEPITYVAATSEVVFGVVHGAAQSGVYAITLSDLLAPGNPMAKPIRELVPASNGGDLVDGIAANRYRPSSPWVYFQRVLCADPQTDDCNALRRVNVSTGEIQPVAHGLDPFDWVSEIEILPSQTPGTPCSVVASANGQEYNNPEVCITPGISFLGPSLISGTTVCEF